MRSPRLRILTSSAVPTSSSFSTAYTLPSTNYPARTTKYTLPSTNKSTRSTYFFGQLKFIRSTAVKLLLVFTVFGLMNQSLAAPITSEKTYPMFDAPNSSNISFILKDAFLGDAPNVNDGGNLPHIWKETIRHFYLRNKDQQFLQAVNGVISGTKEKTQGYALWEFKSHERHVIIQNYMTKEFLCMNSESHLYMSKQLPKDCYIKERSLNHLGYYEYAFEFVNHREQHNNRPLYLAINCKPLRGNSTNNTMSYARFFRLGVTKEEAKQVKAEVLKGHKDGFGVVCENRELEKKQKQRLRKLKERWCRNFSRKIKNRLKTLEECEKRYKCNKNNKNCECYSLQLMLRTPITRTKRKCLRAKIYKFIRKQKVRPNKMKVNILVKLLVANFKRIERRWRQLYSKKQNRMTKILGQTESKITFGNKSEDITSTSTESRASHKHRHGHGTGTTRRFKNKTLSNAPRPLKINRILRSCIPQIFDKFEKTDAFNVNLVDKQNRDCFSLLLKESKPYFSHEKLLTLLRLFFKSRDDSPRRRHGKSNSREKSSRRERKHRRKGHR